MKSLWYHITNPLEYGLICKNNPKRGLVSLALGPDGHLICQTGHFSLIQKCGKDGAAMPRSRRIRVSGGMGDPLRPRRVAVSEESTWTCPNARIRPLSHVSVDWAHPAESIGSNSFS